MRSTTFWLLAACGLVSLAGLSLAAQPPASQPSVHLKSLDATQMKKNGQPLVLETTLRLLAADLAARHGTYARLWPLEQQGQMPADAHPRVEFIWKGYSDVKCVRLERQGDLFIYSGSLDGKEYFEVNRRTMAMPPKTYVGAMVFSHSSGQPIEGVFRQVRLNGKPVTDWQLSDIGGPRFRKSASWQGQTLTLGSVGWWAETDQCERGPFAHQVVEGDFVLEGDFDRYKEEGPYGHFALECRADLAPAADTVAVGGGPLTLCWFRQKPWNRLVEISDYSFQSPEVCYVPADGSEQKHVRVRGDQRTFKGLLESVERVEAQVREYWAGDLKLGPAATAVPASPDQLAALEKANPLAFTTLSGNIYKASRLVDGVLQANPLSPEAHYQASLCGTLLAMQDLRGWMQLQDFTLAGPLAHYMLARRLGPPQRVDDKLAEAWLLLALGYVNDAGAALEALDPSVRQSAQGRAMRTFITRDYRHLADEAVLKAEPIEQLAWVFATQSANRADLLADYPGRMALERRNPSLLPLYSPPGMSGQHDYATLGTSLAFARDVSDLLNCQEIPQSARRQVGDKMLAELDLKASDEQTAARQIAWAVARDGLSEEALPKLLAALMDLYAGALNVPAGPVRLDGESFAWQCVGPRGLAQVQRGLFALHLFNRMDFIQDSWGEPQAANRFAQLAAGGLTAWPGASDFFLAYGANCLRRNAQSTEHLTRMLDTPFVRLPRVPALLVEQWGAAGGNLVRPPGPVRGSWQLQIFANRAANQGFSGYSTSAGCQALVLDSYAAEVMDSLPHHAGTVDVAMPLLERMPYDLGLIRRTAYYAKTFQQADVAVNLYHRYIEMVPTEPQGYYNLVHFYLGAGDLDKALETARQALDRCGFSIGVSNTLGAVAWRLALTGRADEALELGLISRRSYSHSGLEGYAVAMEAKGEVEEARKVYRDMVERYSNFADGYVVCLLRMGAGDEDVLQEISSFLLKQHAQGEDYIFDIAWGIERSGRPDLMQMAFDGPLQNMPQAKRPSYLLGAAMYGREFGRAVEYAKRLEAQEGKFVGNQALWALAAARLARDSQYEAHVKTLLPQMEPAYLVAGQYALGELTAEDLRERALSTTQEGYIRLLNGIDAELRGDRAAALTAYDFPEGSSLNENAQFLGRTWHRRLTGQYLRPWDRTAETQPAALPDPPIISPTTAQADQSP